ncbi:MAG: hypothetical protein AAFR74_08980, partial [Pseudomonadota bacterium]
MRDANSGASNRIREDIEVVCKSEGLPFFFFHCQSEHEFNQAIAKLEGLARANYGFALNIDSHACENKGLYVEQT